MAYTLKLRGGAYSADFLVGGSYILSDKGVIVPPSKKKQIWGANSVDSDGARLMKNSYENKEITIKFSVTGSSRAALVTNIHNIEKILEVARRRSMIGVGGKAELQCLWDGLSQTMYFELLDGDVVWPDNIWSVEQLSQTLPNGKYIIRDMELKLISKPFAYAVSPIDGTLPLITMSNVGGSGTVVTLSNIASTGSANPYATIAADQINGDVEAELVAEIEIDTTDTLPNVLGFPMYLGLQKDYLSHDYLIDNGKLSGLTFTGTYTTVYSATYIGGSAGQVVNSMTAGVSINLASWSLSSAEAENTKGFYRVFLRVASLTAASGKVRGKLELTYSNGLTPVAIHETDEVFIYADTNANFVDLGLLELPPWGQGLIDDSGYTCNLVITDDTTESVTFVFDGLYYLPVGAGVRRYDAVYNTSYLVPEDGDKIIDSAWDNIVYRIDTSASTNSKTIVGVLPRLKLQPSTIYKIYYIAAGATLANINHNIKLSIRKIEKYDVVI